MSGWWYIHGAEQRGPVDKEQLESLVGGLELSPETLVWTVGMPDWLPAKDVELTRSLFLPPPPPINVPPPPRPADELPSNSDPIASEKAQANTVEHRGPDVGNVVKSAIELPQVAWRRYFAKTIDLIAAIAVIVLCQVGLAFVSPTFQIWLANPDNSIFLMFGGLMLTPFVEALIGYTFGNTPGKGFLGLSVRNIQGTRMGFSDHFVRNLRVAWFGLGAFIPVFALFTMIYQYRLLKEHGFTAYDVGRYSIVASKVSGFRMLVAVLFVIGMSVVGIVLDRQTKEEAYRYSSGQEWTNPLTLAVVKVPGGWTAAAQKNADGQTIYVFTRPSEELQVVLGCEELASSIDFPQYFNMFVRAVSSNMKLQPPGYKDSIGLWEAWTVKGRMATDANAKISITFLPHKNSVWRTVGIRFRGANPETKAYRTLREKLLLSAVRSD